MTRLLLSHLFGFRRPETASERRFFRFFESFIVAESVILAWAWAFYVRTLQGVVHPLGLANYVDLSWLYRPGVAVGVAVLVTVLCLMGFISPILDRRAQAKTQPMIIITDRFLSLFTRSAYLLALLLLHLLYVARFSLGKVGHGSMLIGMSLLALAVAAVCFGDIQERRRFVLGSVYFFFGLAYLLAASCKLIATGVTWPDGHHLWMWMGERAVDSISERGSFEANFLQAFLCSHFVPTTALLTIGLVTESLGWLLWWRPARPFIAVALVSMHIGIALILGIRFSLNVVALLLIGLPWPSWLHRYRERKALRNAPLSQRASPL